MTTDILRQNNTTLLFNRIIFSDSLHKSNHFVNINSENEFCNKFINLEIEYILPICRNHTSL